VCGVQSKQITQLLRGYSEGNQGCMDALMPIVYEQLRSIAGDAFRGEQPGHTLQTTALVHEAYARLVGADIDWQDRRHFYAVAARVMRRILVDYANGRNTAKRGDGARHISLDDAVLVAPDVGDDVLALHEALEQLSAEDEELAVLLELYYFGGLTIDEIGKVKDASRSTLHRQLRFAKAWLRARLDDLPA
jgi:RNA polymerase sigma factor (TIGR02999 family)